MPLAAACRATRVEEQAVSIVAHAPCKPNVKERRPEAMEAAAEVAA